MKGDNFVISFLSHSIKYLFKLKCRIFLITFFTSIIKRNTNFSDKRMSLSKVNFWNYKVKTKTEIFKKLYLLKS